MNIIKEAIALVMAVITVTSSASGALTGANMEPRGRAENESQIYEFVTRELDMNMAAACGVLANIEQESNFDPNAQCIDTNGLTSYGICQWNGPRFTSLKNWCSRNGYSYWTLTGQLWYLKYELETSERTAYNAVKNVANTANGAYTAGYNWAAKFERCASRYFYGRAVSARDYYWPKYVSLLNFDCSSTNPDDYMYPSRVLKEGNTGKDVAWVQAVLYQLGHSIDIDGEFGSVTTSRVKSFQRSCGLDADGIVGSATRSKLNSKWEDKKKQKFTFDVNALLDGQASSTLVKNGVTYGTFDIYINGSHYGSSVTDYSGSFSVGTTYEIKNIKANAGYEYAGAVGSLSGTINGNTEVKLKLNAIPEYTLELTGSLDGRAVDSLSGIATADVWVNGSKAADNATGFKNDYTSGATYEINDIRPAYGYSFAGASSGSVSGTVTGGTKVTLGFKTIPTDMGVETKRESWGGHTYILVPRASTWYEANYYSEKLGGTLVSVNSAEEEVFLRQFASKAALWIGGTDLDSEGTWRWVSGESFSYKNWYSGQPNNYKNNDERSENYLCFRAGDKTAGWDDEAGYAKMYFVCEIPSLPLTITKQPENVEVAKEGDIATTTVMAAGDGLSYQWYLKNANGTSFSKSSITTDTYSVKMTRERDGRQIYCVITDQYGNSVKSDTATLSIHRNELKIVTQPQSVEVAKEGDIAATTVMATGDGLTYQWYLKNANGTSFSKSSITTDTYSVKMTRDRDGRQIYCLISDQYGNSVKSDTASLTIAPQRTELKIVTQPQSVEVAKAGDIAKLNVKAQGDGLKYQWYYSNPNQTSFYKCGTNSYSYSIAVTEALDGRRMYCVVSDQYGGSVQSDTVTLTVADEVEPIRTELKIITQPQSVEVEKEGDTATTKVTAQGDGLKYQWYYKNPGDTEFSKGTFTTDTYSTRMTKTSNGRQIYCVISDQYGNSVRSDTVTLTIAMEPEPEPAKTELKIITQPTDAVVGSIGEIAKTFVEAQGDGLTYQWYYKNPGSTRFYKSSTVTSIYSLRMSDSNNGRQVYCVVTDQYGDSVTSDTAELRIEQ